MTPAHTPAHTPLHIETFVEPSFGENGYVVSTLEAGGGQIGWVIDPSFPPQVTQLLEYVAQHHVRIERIILTHGHADHLGGVDEVRHRHRDARVAIAEAERGALEDADINLSALMGMPFTLQTRPDDDLPAGGRLHLGSLEWDILDVSGHSPAGRALYCRQARVVITGDALFAGGIGRYDFPGSDGRRLLRNIRTNLLSLPDNTRAYPGHGPATTIENERKFNPFLAD